jgi:hypothetical protein
MHKEEAGVAVHRLLKRASEILRIEARVAVHLMVTMFRQDQFVNQCGDATLPLARIPQAECKVFLIVRSEDVAERSLVDRLGECY